VSRDGPGRAAARTKPAHAAAPGRRFAGFFSLIRRRAGSNAASRRCNPKIPALKRRPPPPWTRVPARGARRALRASGAQSPSPAASFSCRYAGLRRPGQECPRAALAARSAPPARKVLRPLPAFHADTPASAALDKSARARRSPRAPRLRRAKSFARCQLFMPIRRRPPPQSKSYKYTPTSYSRAGLSPPPFRSFACRFCGRVPPCPALPDGARSHGASLCARRLPSRSEHRRAPIKNHRYTRPASLAHRPKTCGADRNRLRFSPLLCPAERRVTPPEAPRPKNHR
jgi:hypothetical protein